MVLIRFPSSTSAFYFTWVSWYQISGEIHYLNEALGLIHRWIYLHQGFVGCSHSTRELKQCLPVATFDDAVLSRPQNASIIKRQLGHFKNLSTCVSHCCRSSKCDVALFDGTFCYGVFCPTENVCHFEKAREGQRSYQTVLLKDIFAGKCWDLWPVISTYLWQISI